MNDSFDNTGLGFDGQADSMQSYALKTFGWMFLGLLVTFLTGVLLLATGAVWQIYTIPALPFILLGAELILVMVLSGKLTSLQPTTARMLFFGYALLNGVTFSAIFALYDLSSLMMIFGMTTLYFGVMALYGYFTKADLSRIGKVLTFGLVFLLVFWVMSMFMDLSGMETAICLLGIVIFLGCTAYDTYRMRDMYTVFSADQAMLQKASIFCALQLYLDFINLFLYLIRLLGRSRD